MRVARNLFLIANAVKKKYMAESPMLDHCSSAHQVGQWPSANDAFEVRKLVEVNRSDVSMDQVE